MERDKEGDGGADERDGEGEGEGDERDGEGEGEGDGEGDRGMHCDGGAEPADGDRNWDAGAKGDAEAGMDPRRSPRW